MNTQEFAKCDFCTEIKPVNRFYIRIKNKHFDDNEKGRYSAFVKYCDDCGIDVDVIKEREMKEYYKFVLLGVIIAYICFTFFRIIFGLPVRQTEKCMIGHTRMDDWTETYHCMDLVEVK